MTLEEAIRYAEHPLDLVAEVSPERRGEVFAEMNQLFVVAEHEQSLVWQAFRARATRRDAPDPVEVAQREAARGGSSR